MIIEPDLDVIGQIVDLYGDKSSAAWSRYHETERGYLTMAFWENHFEWKFVVSRYSPCIVVDYGCGTAHSDVFLADAGFGVIGYEPNLTNFHVAQYVVSVQTQNIRSGIYLTNTPPVRELAGISLVWISHVLEHVPKEDWRDFFKPIVSNGWKILISVPLGRAYYVPSHINIWDSESELVADLEAAGLTVQWSEIDSENNVIRVEAR